MASSHRPAIECRAVLFDLFGTLIIYGDMTRAWRAWLETLHRALAEEGVSLEPQRFAERLRGFFSRPEPPPDGPGETEFDRRLIALLAELGIALSPEAAVRARRPAIDAWMAHVDLDPEAKGLLRAIRRSRKVALVSNFDAAEPVERILSDLDLACCFDAIAVSDAVGFKKPDPAIFHWVLERLGVGPAEAIHVGDTEDDIDGARAAGVRPVLIERWDMDELTVDYHFEGEAPRGSAAHRSRAGPDGLVRVSSLAEVGRLLGL